MDYRSPKIFTNARERWANSSQVNLPGPTKRSPMKPMPHVGRPRLKRLNSTILFVAQRTLDSFVKTSRRDMGLNATVEGLRVLVKPQAEFLQLLRRELRYRAFDFLDCV